MTEDPAASDNCGHAAPGQCGRQPVACCSSSGMQDAATCQRPERQHTQRLRPLLATSLQHSVVAGTAADAQNSSWRLRLCRSAWWRSSFAHCHLTMVLLLAILLHAPAGTAAKQCTRFRPSGCHFTTRHNEPVLYPACKSACHFEVEQELQCPFHSAGVFVTEEAAECTDPFMEGPMQRPRRLPDCSHHCCRAQETVGAFLSKPTAAQPHRLLFQPGGERSCRYEQYSRAEVLAALQGGSAEGEHPGMDIVVLGDSLMRQLFSRLVHMMRGHARVVDYKMHTHASYSVCQEADAFRTAPFNGNRTRLAARTDPDHLLSLVPGFFRAGSNVEPGMLCSRRPAAAIHYAHAPRWRDQIATLERMWPAVTPRRRAVVVLSTGFADKASDVRQEYLEMLTSLIDKVERVFVIGTPLSRVSNEEWRAAHKARNAALAAWAAAAGPRAEYINFGMLANAPGGPAAGAGGSWHYQCFLQWPSWKLKKLRTAAEAGNYFRDREYGRPVEGLIVTEDGHCADEMNRNIWQLIFNVLLGHRGRPATPDELASAKCCGRSGTGENARQRAN